MLWLPTIMELIKNCAWYACSTKNLAELLQLLDPEGIIRRKAKKFIRRAYIVPGPNFVWHVDGYDKLKPFGFAILGCSDGFSRRILWLEVGPSNNDPKVIANYYFQLVEQQRIVPD